MKNRVGALLLCAALVLGQLALSQPAIAAQQGSAAQTIGAGLDAAISGGAAATVPDSASVQREPPEKTAVETYTAVESGNPKQMGSKFGTITVQCKSDRGTYGLRATRTYTYPDRAVFSCSRYAVETLPKDALLLEAVSLTGSSGTIRYYVNGKLRQQPLEPGLYGGDVWFLSTGTGSMIVSVPACYAARENQTMEELTGFSGGMLVEKQRGGWKISIAADGIPETGCNLEYYVLRSGEQLVDWSRGNAAEMWSQYVISGDNRWTYDGYYYAAPHNYIPTGDRYFHRMPDPYIPIKMLSCGDLGAIQMTIAMLDIQAEQQNAAGWFPTWAGSQWLLDDYGIGPGFFDTRFNTDLAAGLLTAYQYYGIDEFYRAVARYMDYFRRYVQQNSRSCTADGRTGLLVSDYGTAEGGGMTHTSLNHQLAEILLLYRWGGVTGDDQWNQLAGQMLDGICAVGEQWIKPDHDLWYASAADGQMSRQDYPYLTYNDLYRLRSFCTLHEIPWEPELQALMDAKKLWMDANGVTDYLR